MEEELKSMFEIVENFLSCCEVPRLIISRWGGLVMFFLNIKLKVEIENFK